MGGGAAALAAAAALAGWTYHLGQRYAAGGAALEEVGELREQRDQLLAERDKLQRAASTVDSKSTIEKSVQKELTEQIRTLTAENQKLKDDLSFFEGLAQAGTRADGISLPNVKLETPVPGQLRYRALVCRAQKRTVISRGNPVFAEFGAGRKTCYDHPPRYEKPGNATAETDLPSLPAG
jgi:hypothetical protein